MTNSLDYEQCECYCNIIRLLEIKGCFAFGPILVDPKVLYLNIIKLLFEIYTLYIFPILFFLVKVISS